MMNTDRGGNEVKRSVKIIRIYVIGALCLLAYLWMDYSADLQEFLEKVERSRDDWKFGLLTIIGLVKFGLIVTALSIFGITSFLLIKKRMTKSKDRSQS